MIRKMCLLFCSPPPTLCFFPISLSFLFSTLFSFLLPSFSSTQGREANALFVPPLNLEVLRELLEESIFVLKYKRAAI